MARWSVLVAVPLIAVALAVTGSTATRALSSPPNIVVVIVDDQPNLDGRLVNYMQTVRQVFAEHGLTFSNFHSETPLCCPARAGFLTGLHTLNHNVLKNEAKTFNPKMTLATQLHAAGYYTILVGKYLNNYDSIARKGACAPGWDQFIAFGDPAYYDYYLWGNCNANPVEYHGATPGDYSVDVVANHAVDYLHRAPPDQPVFAWIAPYAPHAPTTPAPRYANSTACDSVKRWDPPNFNKPMLNPPAYVANLSDRFPSSGKSLKAACLALLGDDDLVAAVKAELATEGRLDNTIFVYTGDNGMNEGEHGLPGKSTPYATDIPFYVSWPDGLGTTPRTISERVQNIDLAPTICALVGCTLGPYPDGQQTPDGISFACLMLQTCTTLGRDAVLEDLPLKNAFVPPWYAVQTGPSSPLGQWLYIEDGTGETELYDMVNDPWTMDNVAGDQGNAPLVAALHGRLVELKAEKGH